MGLVQGGDGEDAVGDEGMAVTRLGHDGAPDVLHVGPHGERVGRDGRVVVHQLQAAVPGLSRRPRGR